MGLLDLDTDEVVAVLMADNAGRWHRPLTEFTLTIEPESCAIEPMAGKRLMGALKDLLVLIGGEAHIDDHRLGQEDLDKLADDINKIMRRRMGEAYDARLQRMSNGELRRLGLLSFQYQVIQDPGSRKKVFRYVDFDCSGVNKDYPYAHGIEMAEEVIAFCKKHKREQLDIQSMLLGAFHAIEEGRSLPYGQHAASQAAQGFLSVMTTLICVGTKLINPAWIESRKSESRSYVDRVKQLDAEEKAQFVARMRAARIAAQAKRKKKASERGG